MELRGALLVAARPQGFDEGSKAFDLVDQTALVAHIIRYNMLCPTEV